MPRKKDDEIPLTLLKPSIIQETKARFDSLLRAKHNNQDENLKKVKKKTAVGSSRNDDSRPSKTRHKWKLSTSTQKLLSQDEFSSNDDRSDDQAQSHSSDSVTAIQTPVHQPSLISRTSSSSTPITPFHSPEPTAANMSDDCSFHFDVIQESLDTCEKSNSPPSALPTAPIPLPRTTRSVREESRETTSSRMSSPDSVKTAIEAISPSRSTSRSLKISHQRSMESGSVSNLQLKEATSKQNTALSPSYEEIDETSLDIGQLSSKATILKEEKDSKKTLQNAVSYEEISEENLSTKSLTNFQSVSLTTEDSSEDLENSEMRSATSQGRLKVKPKKRRLSKRKYKTGVDSDDSYIARRPGSHSKKKKDSTRLCIKSDDQFTYENIIGITIHCADTLKVNRMIQHPMVRVHIIDTLTGEYLKKSQACRNVSYYNENSNVKFIQPLTCSPCSFLNSRSLTPVWEETLIFNEDIEYILNTDSAILIFFEVLDLLPLDVAIRQYDKLGPECCWHRIAWAFLKPRGANNVLNTNKRIRLQLYKPRPSRANFTNKRCDRCDVYQWWYKGGWIRYPSTLHVSVRGMPALNFQPGVRSYFALQPEEVPARSVVQSSPVNDNADLNVSSKSKEGRSTDAATENSGKWMRLPSQSCKIPNARQLHIPTGVKGCFSLKFSHQGKYLAFSAVNNNMHFVHICQVSNGVEDFRFQGHLGLIYSLEWSSDDELLVTASADCTACVWSLKSGKSRAPSQILPHPSFVYSAVFVEQSDVIGLITGCSDHILRFWKKKDVSQFQLMQEMSGHDGFVSALCMSPNAVLLSGDSVGEIRLWNMVDSKHSWKCGRTIKIRELKGVVISQMILHPGGKRLLVHARDSLLRMVDINTGVPIQWFKGALNHHIHSGACISPCGGLLFSASEDGHYYVWNVDTGVLQATYSTVIYPSHGLESEANGCNYQRILSCSVAYHPFKHLAAFASYGSQAPVTLCVYDRYSNGKEIGLKHYCEKTINPSKNYKNMPTAPQPPTLKEAIQLDTALSDETGTNSFSEIHETMGNVKDQVGGRRNKHLSNIIRQLDTVLQFSLRDKAKQYQSPCLFEEDSPHMSTSSDMFQKTPNQFQKRHLIKNNYSKTEESAKLAAAAELSQLKFRDNLQALRYMEGKGNELGANYEDSTSMWNNDTRYQSTQQSVIPPFELQSDSSVDTSLASSQPEDAETILTAPLQIQSLETKKSALEKDSEVSQKVSQIMVVQSKELEELE